MNSLSKGFDKDELLLFVDNYVKVISLNGQIIDSFMTSQIFPGIEFPLDSVTKVFKSFNDTISEYLFIKV